MLEVSRGKGRPKGKWIDVTREDQRECGVSGDG